MGRRLQRRADSVGMRTSWMARAAIPVAIARRPPTTAIPPPGTVAGAVLGHLGRFLLSGVSLTEQQLEMIKTLQEVGDFLEAQVLSVEASPEIAEWPGYVVPGTVTRLNNQRPFLLLVGWHSCYIGSFSRRARRLRAAAARMTGSRGHDVDCSCAGSRQRMMTDGAALSWRKAEQCRLSSTSSTGPRSFRPVPSVSML